MPNAEPNHSFSPIPPLTIPSAVPPSPLDQNPAAVYLASLGAGSRPTMRTALNTIADLLGVSEKRDAQEQDVRYLDVPWGDLRDQHTTAIRSSLQERYAPATANKLLVALRRVLKEARRLGQISAEDYDRATDLSTVPGEPTLRGRLVTHAEFQGLMRACCEDPTPAGARDAAILALLRGTGIRRSEVAALNLDDYNPEHGAVTLRTGSGERDRTIYVPPGTRVALADWLAVRGAVAGPLFYGVVKGGALVPRRLAGQAMAVICASRAAQAGVPPFTPHDLRRSFISGLFDAGADPAVVQRLAGHEDLATTSRYDRRGEEARRRAVELIDIPYVARQSKAM